MRAFWRFVQQSSKPVFTGRELKDRIGDELAHVLWREQIVVPIAGSSSEDWRSSQCSDDVVLRLSVEHLVEILRRDLPIEVVPAATSSFGSAEKVVAIGMRLVDGAPTEVFLALHPVSEAFLWFVQLRRLTPARTKILVPTNEALPPQFMALCGHGGQIQLAFLDEILCLRHGRIGAAARRATTAPGPFCQVTDASGDRQLTRPEYHAIIAASETHDLLIDMTTTVSHGLYRAVASMFGMPPRIADLPWNQAAVLVELGIARRPMRVNELTSVQVEHPDKLIERARSVVDIELSRRTWRAFKTLPTDSRRDKRYFFDPPDGFRFAFLYL